MGRTPCCDGASLKRGPWTPEEDQKLSAYIQEHGHGSWRTLPQKAGLQRCGKSCRLRWINYLRPGIKRGKFTLHEEQTIIQLHALLGNRWAVIAMHLPRRTDNEIKNYWNTHLKKMLAKMGIDPVTHRRKVHVTLGSSSATLSHMVQWESTRLEAEARLVRESKLHQHSNPLGFGCSDRILPHEPNPFPPLSTHSSVNEVSNTTLALPHCLDMLNVWQCGGSGSGGVSASGVEAVGISDFTAPQSVEAFISSHHDIWIGEPTDEGYTNLSSDNLDEWMVFASGNGDGSFEENTNCWNYETLNNCGTLESLVF
ncbi:hypothetical protein F0562_023409 [Nyssa sinensis]|uniref:Uncharacterized protein n=1 Tax=Nyssa sinensis TaxID=561372 RepID=A0A5J5BH32_9ASTE|nr:hypothetical protein F0562_023409 [Nyssa sinensis]